MWPLFSVAVFAASHLASGFNGSMSDRGLHGRHTFELQFASSQIQKTTNKGTVAYCTVVGILVIHVTGIRTGDALV